MTLLAILRNLRLVDLLDILFLSIMAYHLYVWFRQTKALKALIGLLGLGVIYTAASTWGLFLTTWVFQILWQVLVLLLIILFQSEIRQVLERVNPLRALGGRREREPDAWIPPFAGGVFELARRRIGALLILEREDLVDEHITEGQSMDAAPSPEMLVSLFQKESPLHDGAALIRNGRLIRVAAYLPLSSADNLPKHWGTRHRAAAGLSERCDAWVIVVSEERGELVLARQGRMTPVGTPEELSRYIAEGIHAPAQSRETTWGRIRDLLTHRWKEKGASVALVSLLWLLLAGQQNFERTLQVPLDIRNLPERLEVLQPVNPEIRITVRGLRKDASTLSRKDVHSLIDLSPAAVGVRFFRITREQILLANDRLSVVNIDPAQIRFEFKEKP